MCDWWVGGSHQNGMSFHLACVRAKQIGSIQFQFGRIRHDGLFVLCQGFTSPYEE